MAENRYSLMSYNILCDKPKPERIDRLIALVKKYNADTIGMQEVTPYWLSFLSPRLTITFASVSVVTVRTKVSTAASSITRISSTL